MKAKTRKMLASLSARVIELADRLACLEKNQPAPGDQFVAEGGVIEVHPDALSLLVASDV